MAPSRRSTSSARSGKSTKRICKVRGGKTHATPTAGILPKEAYAMLRTYSEAETLYPNKDQLVELLTKIHLIPGCEGCETSRIQAYFRERRRTVARAARFRCNQVTEARRVDVNPPSCRSSPLTSFSEDEDEIGSASMVPTESVTPSDSGPSLDSVPRTFGELGRWLEQQNRRLSAIMAVW